jgi:two-component system cell cycle sensor histidine kinase/response regulator CckA
MTSITSEWLRVLIGAGIVTYGASYGWLVYTDHVGFVIDPYCIILFSVVFVVSTRNVRWGLLIGISSVALDVFASLLLAGEFCSQPTMVVAPALILLVMLFLGRWEGALAGVTIAASIPLAIGISGLVGWGPGILDSSVMHGLIVLEMVIGVTILALYVHTRSMEEVRATHSQDNDRFRLLVESMPDGIILMSPEGQIEEFNPAAEKLLGIGRESVMGHVLDHAPLGLPSKLLEVARSLSPQEVCLGAGRFLEVTPSTTAWHGGPSRLLLVLRDVSARKQYQARSEDLRSQLVRSQKLEAVGRLAAGVAHDFNNILTVVSGYIGLRELEELSESDPVVDMAEAVTMGTKLVRQLLVFSKDEPSPQRSIDVTRAVQRIEPIIRRLLGDNIELVIECDDFCTIIGNDGKLEQVLVNLTTNAADAMSDGGTFTIRCALVDDEVVLSVSDTGHGIPEEIRDKIFDVFFTTKDSAHGTGLGLATVYAVVTEFQGTIAFESSSAGTTFRMGWPPVDRDVPMEVSWVRPLSPTHLHQKRVLLVEDNDAARVMLARYLRKKGFLVSTADSGDSVLNDPELWNHPPDIIVTDLVMPGISGIELINLMRARWGQLPFLLMSGYTAETLADEPPDTLEHLMEKPFPPSELVARIVDALA